MNSRTKTAELLTATKRKIEKALIHLEYSYKKVKLLPTNPSLLDEESLETWESFSARFSRVVDLFLTKYIRTSVLIKDPGFEGSFIDFLNQAEKLLLIENSEEWLSLRALRNITVHDYSEEELQEYFETLLTHTPSILINLKKIS